MERWDGGIKETRGVERGGVMDGFLHDLRSNNILLLAEKYSLPRTILNQQQSNGLLIGRRSFFQSRGE